jgi:hypothetical protein
LAYYGFRAYPYYLPRGLNTAISRETVNHIRSVFGSVYSGINPDFGLAYKLMLLNRKVGFVGRSLFCSKFTELSNGGNSSRGLNWDYLKSVSDGDNILSKSHLKLPICSNTIFSDIIKIIEEAKNNEKLNLVKRKIAFAGYCATKLELKRFYARRIINKNQYDEGNSMLIMNKKMYKSFPHSLSVFIYSLIIRMVPLYLLR